jgi:hypothetical protein
MLEETEGLDQDLGNKIVERAHSKNGLDVVDTVVNIKDKDYLYLKENIKLAEETENNFAKRAEVCSWQYFSNINVEIV